MKYTSTHNKKGSNKEQVEMCKKFDLHDIPEFSINFRGYNKYETDKYLSAFVDAYVQLFEENLEMELELDEYRKNKAAISDTLIAAERIMQLARKQVLKMTPLADSESAAEKAPVVEQADSLDIGNLIKDIKSRKGG